MESSEEFRLRYLERIRDARQRLSLTQTEFAAMAGVSKRTVYDWESGKGFPQPKHRKRLDQIFHVVERTTATLGQVANGV